MATEWQTTIKGSGNNQPKEKHRAVSNGNGSGIMVPIFGCIAYAFQSSEVDFMSFQWNHPDGMDSIVRHRKESYKLKYQSTYLWLIDTLACTIRSSIL
jgi:hypothetical protein